MKLDPSDAKLALERAEAQLAQTVREVRTLYVNNAALAASVPFPKRLGQPAEYAQLAESLLGSDPAEAGKFSMAELEGLLAPLVDEGLPTGPESRTLR